MKKLKIGVDIDGTITDPYCWLPLGNNYFGTNLKPEDVKEYELDKVLGVSRGEYLDFYRKFGEFSHLTASERTSANRKLKELSHYHSISYVSAREYGMAEVTKKWFSIRNFPQQPVFLLGSHDKVEKAKELECDLFIEDRWENAVQLAKRGIKVFLIDCYYNRLPLVPGVTRVNNWDDIAREAQKISA